MDKTRHDSLGLEHTSSCNAWSLTISALESSVADHLQCPRSIPARLPSPSFQPPYPGFSVRFPQDVSQLVIAIVGSQHRPSVSPTSVAVSTSHAAISSFLASTRPSTPPSFVEWASVTDNRGYYNLCALAYWDGKSSYESWASSSGFKAWWDGLDADADSQDDDLDQGPGWFLEILSPTTDRFETLFNTDSAREGSSHFAGACMSSAVQEHGYWGSMRDRIPLSQTDVLSANNTRLPSPSQLTDSNADHRKKRITIPRHRNLAIIRSGQDWSTTTPEERKLYLQTMHPILQKGMDFLQNHGKEEVGCYSCRFMHVLDSETEKTDRTFGLAYFDELASLERWSKEHETHLAIFGGFFRYAQQLGNNVTLRVFHEVMVLEEGQQFFEYVGCHGDTGMLASRG
ncbi:hem-containing dehydratase protein [Rhypophila decipiens]|uniref:Hem-containing dehydratase protein n=1 Tax=Rhypophila decipiens TaxID=261697 RepID=A0AAN6Y027_9PEZI|nr:hem-containing dehydratase protein [Rhypophila decipiens]